MLNELARETEKPSNAEVLDAAMVADLLELRDGRHLDIDGIVDRFIAGAPAKLDAVASAVAAGDADAAGRVAHEMAGSSATLGAAAFGKLCSHLERCSRTGDLDAVAESLPSARTEFERVRVALRGAFSGTSGNGDLQVSERAKWNDEIVRPSRI